MMNDEITEKLQLVDSVSTYIENLRTLQNVWCEEDWFMVYRGENEVFEMPCIPSIYREHDIYQTSSYEVNMFMAMRQNELSNSTDYLHNAIDAQHDGFPSRLLDVTYNSLIALYFAVTPYYYQDESASDDKDGMVYVFKYDEVYSPEAANTKTLYEEAMKGGGNVKSSPFLAYHHPLIDHCKQNKRIVAQHGAFILFQGKTPIPVPNYLMCGVRISRDAKKKIRNELKTMFGIYTGSVYPEVELMQEEIRACSLRINSESEDVEKATIKDLEKEYIYFADCCDYFVREKKNKGRAYQTD